MYFKYDQQTISDFSTEVIDQMYDKGFVMTRIGKGVMNQVESIRINLEKFEPTSENRRVLRKTEDLRLEEKKLPVSSQDYNWVIHKVGKEFYAIKFGDDTFSANKIKELITGDHNFNILFQYYKESEDQPIGYCISIQTPTILHYCYPFYRLDIDTGNLGMGMMLKAINWAKENSKKYIYLGSMSPDQNKYKLQFKGLEVWNNADQNWKEVEI